MNRNIVSKCVHALRMCLRRLGSSIENKKKSIKYLDAHSLNYHRLRAPESEKTTATVLNIKGKLSCVCVFKKCKRKRQESEVTSQINTKRDKNFFFKFMFTHL